MYTAPPPNNSRKQDAIRSCPHFMEEKAKVEIKLLACSRSRSWCEFPNGVKITPSLNSVKLQHSRKDRVISCHQKPGSHENKVCELLRMFKSKGLW